MKNHTHPQTNPASHLSDECTIQMRDGRFCSALVWPEAPYAICKSHAVSLYMTMRGMEQDAHAKAGGLLGLHDDEREASLHAKAVANQARSVVYYVRIGDSIKIGYTVNLKSRMSALRVRQSDVLATEPGGKALEAQRHRKFAAIRKGKREDFEPTFALIQHIDAVRERYGDPQF